jgi:hypothetical protein
MTMTTANPMSMPGRDAGHLPGWRVAVSIATTFGWVSFILLYLGFWAHAFRGLQSAVLILVSILVFIAINGATWASWGVRRAPAQA